jgi:hypothetical protein
VFVATENDTVLFRPVTIGIEDESVIEILQGVEEGDRVVTTGAAALQDGERVLIAGGGRGGRSGRGRGEQAQAPATGTSAAGSAAAAATEGSNSEGASAGRRGRGGFGGRRGGQPAASANP